MQILIPFFLLIATSSAWGLSSSVKVPTLTGPVVDEAGIFSVGERAELTREVEQLNNSGKVQMAILVTASLQELDIESFSMEVAEAWSLGRKGIDNGILLVVAPNDKKMRIEVGYGLEGVITDAKSSRILREELVPKFRRGDFLGGISAGVARIGQELGVVEGSPRSERSRSRQGRPMPLWFLLLIFVFVIFKVLSALTGVGRSVTRRRSWYSSGGGWSGGGWGGGFGGGGGGFGGGGSSSSW